MPRPVWGASPRPPCPSEARSEPAAQAISSFDAICRWDLQLHLASSFALASAAFFFCLLRYLAFLSLSLFRISWSLACAFAFACDGWRPDAVSELTSHCTSPGLRRALFLCFFELGPRLLLLVVFLLFFLAPSLAFREQFPLSSLISCQG